MKRMLALMLGLGLVSGVWCKAEEAGHRQLVAELFKQIDMALVLNETVSQVAASIATALPMEAGYQEVVDAYVHKYADWEALEEDIISIYAKAFTAEDVRDLINFYNTAAGRKLLDQAPTISREIAMLVHARLTDHSADLKQMMMDADFMAFQNALGDDEEPAADEP